jgi:hypothetical protein
MSKRPASDQPKDAGEDKRPAGTSTDAPVEHPRRLNRPRDPYKNRVLTPDRMNGGYDTKD